MIKKLFQSLSSKCTPLFLRSFGVQQGEAKLQNILNEKFPMAKEITVEDISGGCGAMYQVYVEASEFNGLKILDQHRLVKEALKNEIKEMHGITLKTKASS